MEVVKQRYDEKCHMMRVPPREGVPHKEMGGKVITSMVNELREVMRERARGTL